MAVHLGRRGVPTAGADGGAAGVRRRGELPLRALVGALERDGVGERTRLLLLSHLGDLCLHRNRRGHPGPPGKAEAGATGVKIASLASTSRQAEAGIAGAAAHAAMRARYGRSRHEPAAPARHTPASIAWYVSSSVEPATRRAVSVLEAMERSVLSFRLRY
eukprot:gene16989-2513_t